MDELTTWISRLRFHLLGCFLLFLVIQMVTLVKSDGFSGIPGQYCSKRTPTCCTARNDRCAVELLGTECYCDEFCDRREGGDVPDCCPDYYAHCRGIRAPDTTTLPTSRRPLELPRVVKGCWMHDRFHPLGTQLKRNCNHCTCQVIEDVNRQEVYEFLCDNQVCLIQDDLVERVNANPHSYRWTAARYPFFYGMTLADGYRYRLGTFKPTGSVARMHEIRIDRNAVLPDRFDARERWSGLIHPVRDQGNCASSWAFSTAELASDRISIMTRGEMASALSPQHLLSCNKNRQKGCEGGHLDRAWWFLHRKTGIVTEKCYPYVGEAAVNERCGIVLQDTTTAKSCPSGADERHLWQITPPYRIANNELEIKYEISTNGPVQAVFRVSPSFFSYKSGVYQSLEATPVDDPTNNYHSVRIIGWGTDHTDEPAVPYWLCTNSWGSAWGESGTFRILRGQNEAEIESFVVGVWGKKRSNEGGVTSEGERNNKLKRQRRHETSVKKRVDTVVRLLDEILE